MMENNNLYNERKIYMEKYNREETKLIYLSRCGYFPCKQDYKFAYKNKLKCRWCDKSAETRIHVLEKCRKCPVSNEGTYAKIIYGDEEEVGNFLRTIKKYKYYLNERNENY